MLRFTRPGAIRWLRAALIPQLVAASLCCLSSQAQAAFKARVLVVSAASVSRASRTSVERALASLGDLLNPAEYVAAAKQQSLKPDSEEALSQIAPGIHARLIVVLAPAHGKLRVSFRDGRDGAPLNAVSVAMTHGSLARGGGEQVGDAAEYALSLLQNSQQAPAAAFSQPPQQQPAQVVEPAPPPYAAAQMVADAPVIAQPPERNEVPESYETEPAEAVQSGAAPAAPEAPDGLSAGIGLGFGFGQRSVSVPSGAGTHSLDTSPFPALEVRIDAGAPVVGQFFLGLHFDYQTSVGLHEFQTTGDSANAKGTPLRSHHIGFGVEPRLRFTDSRDAVSLGFLLGWAFRGLRPVVDLDLPPYTLYGPLLRPELRIPIAHGLVVLRLAPELFFITGITEELQRLAALSGTGIALGIEVSIDIRLIDRVYMMLTFRESHANTGSSWSGNFTDNERFATVGAVLRY
jgi:hypothetical protein